MAALNWHADNQMPFSSATFAKSGPTVFAEEIRSEVETWLFRPAFPFGSGLRTKKYDVTLVDVDTEGAAGERVDEALQYLDAVIEAVGKDDRMELMEWCLNQPEVQRVRSGQTVLFDG